MKKGLLLLLVVIVICSCKNRPSTSLNSEVEKLRQEVAELKQQVDEKDDVNPDDNDDSAPMDDSCAPDGKSLSFSLSGRIGEYYDCSMVVEHGEGTVYLDHSERDIAFTSYNPHNGQLVYDAYYTNGKYIGQYIGHYTTGAHPSYVGTFYNVKGGTVTFELN